jgi:hypothetical protein
MPRGIGNLGYYIARSFVHIFRISQQLVPTLQNSGLNHVVLKADTKVSKQQNLYLQADFSKILISSYMTTRFLNPEEQNVKKLHDFLLPSAVRIVSLMQSQCAGHVVWRGDIQTFGGRNLSETGHLEGKWFIRMGAAWSWFSIASNGKL